MNMKHVNHKTRFLMYEKIIENLMTLFKWLFFQHMSLESFFITIFGVSQKWY